MPSQLHEALLLLFRNRPQLAPELLRDALLMELPRYTEARIDSADLTDIQPAEYRADLVVLLLDGVPVLGIVVEAQLSPDERKRFVWPVYAANLRARLECPVCLLVVTADEAVARWAARPIDVGGGNRFTPLVLRPSGVPEITDEAQAQADPELAVLSAMAHGRDVDTGKSVQIAFAAQMASLGLDEDRSRLYFDLVLVSLSDAARRELQTMDPGEALIKSAGYCDRRMEMDERQGASKLRSASDSTGSTIAAKYEYQSDFARRYVAQGIEQGVAQGQAEGCAKGERSGRAALIIRLLTVRFGPLSDAARARIASASVEELDAIGERLLTAPTLREAMSG